jgi:thymidylate synthase (FAD)
LRTGHGTQHEHMEIAELCKRHFICQFPTIAQALEWCPEENCGCEEYADCLQPSLRID